MPTLLGDPSQTLLTLRLSYPVVFLSLTLSFWWLTPSNPISLGLGCGVCLVGGGALGLVIEFPGSFPKPSLNQSYGSMSTTPLGLPLN